MSNTLVDFIKSSKESWVSKDEICIAVENSKEIQELLFKNNFSWGNSGFSVAQQLHLTRIFISQNKAIWGNLCNTPDYPVKIYSLEEIKKVLEPVTEQKKSSEIIVYCDNKKEFEILQHMCESLGYSTWQSDKGGTWSSTTLINKCKRTMETSYSSEFVNFKTISLNDLEPEKPFEVNGIQIIPDDNSENLFMFKSGNDSMVVSRSFINELCQMNNKHKVYIEVGCSSFNFDQIKEIGKYVNEYCG